MVLNAAQGSPGRQLCTATMTSGSELGGPPRSGAVSGDLGVPDLPGGDHSMDVAQDRGGDHGLSLGRLEPVVLAGGQVPVAGTVDRVARWAPRPFARQRPAAGPTLARELGSVPEAACGGRRCLNARIGNGESFGVRRTLRGSGRGPSPAGPRPDSWGGPVCGLPRWSQTGHT